MECVYNLIYIFKKETFPHSFAYKNIIFFIQVIQK